MPPFPQNDREAFVAVALSHLGRWYVWGGDDPRGFDCSGLVVECLRSIGIINDKTDLSAAAMYEAFREYEVEFPFDVEPGTLIFWKNDADMVVHVEVAVNKRLSIGARGGGPDVITHEQAARRNAYIRIAPIYGRSMRVMAAIDLFNGDTIRVGMGRGEA